MQDQPNEDGRPRMHPATILLRQILELNELMEFAMRRAMALNETDFQAMQHLIKGRSLSPSELAQSLHLTAAATTTVIDRLVRKGKITRASHPTDRRRLLISPSAEAIKETMDRLMPMILDVDAKARSYGHEGQAAIVDFLNSVALSMRESVAAMDVKPAELVPVEPPNGEG